MCIESIKNFDTGDLQRINSSRISVNNTITPQCVNLWVDKNKTRGEKLIDLEMSVYLTPQKMMSAFTETIFVY